MTQPKSKAYIGNIFDVFDDEDFVNEIGIFQGDVTSSWSIGDSEASDALSSAFDYAADSAFNELAYCLRYSHMPPGQFGLC